MALVTTATTMALIETMHKTLTRSILGLTLLTVNPISVAQQQDAGLFIATSAEVAYIHQDLISERTDGRNEAQTFQFTPTVSLDYRSRRFQGRWATTYTHLQRDIEDQDRNDSFTEYLYNAQFVAIDNLLTFQANGALNYQNVQSDGYLIDDFLLNSDELSKTRSNRFSVVSNIPRGRYFGANGSLSYSDTQSEDRADNNNANLDNNSYSAQGELVSGNGIDWLDWSVNGSYQNTERDFQDDFISRLAGADLSFIVMRNLGISFTAQHEANQLGTDQTNFSQAREFNSAGAGFTLRQSETRYITLTYNISDSSRDEGDNDKNFIGVDFNWDFSARTRVSGNYSRRFFGESGRFSFTHNTKSLRTQIRYSEDVTSFSRLIADPENLGVFVCQDGNLDLLSCFQPNSLSYQLKPGEQFVQFSQQNAEINDEIILRKGLNGQIGYEFGRLRLSLDARYALDEYLEIDRIQRTLSAGFNSALKIGAYTNITARVQYAETEQRSSVVNSGSSQTWEASTGLTRDIGQHLSASIDFRFLDRDGTLQTGFGGQELTDRRISASIRYTY